MRANVTAGALVEIDPIRSSEADFGVQELAGNGIELHGTDRARSETTKRRTATRPRPARKAACERKAAGIAHRDNSTIARIAGRGDRERGSWLGGVHIIGKRIIFGIVFSDAMVASPVLAL